MNCVHSTVSFSRATGARGHRAEALLVHYLEDLSLPALHKKSRE
jgi:hypothetical protein